MTLTCSSLPGPTCQDLLPVCHKIVLDFLRGTSTKSHYRRLLDDHSNAALADYVLIRLTSRRAHLLISFNRSLIFSEFLFSFRRLFVLEIFNFAPCASAFLQLFNPIRHLRLTALPTSEYLCRLRSALGPYKQLTHKTMRKSCFCSRFRPSPKT